MLPSHSASSTFRVLRKILKRFDIHNYIIAIDSVNPNRIRCEIFEKWLLKRDSEKEAEELIGEKDEIKTFFRSISSKEGLNVMFSTCT